MKVSREYSSLFNSITETIDQLGKIIFTASSCMEILKKAQMNTEEIFISEDNNEMDSKCCETSETN